MSLTVVLAVILAVALSFYAVLAGADFGAGILDLSSALRAGGGAERDRVDRKLISAVIGPLWEANHVWLIFSITVLFSGFPRAFSAIGTGLLAPLMVALLAIVVRGVALGVRSGGEFSPRSNRLLSTAFGIASVVAPFAFGVSAGGLAAAASAVPPRGGTAPAIPWSGPFALIVGALAVALCVQLAAAFVSRRCARSGDGCAAARFRGRAIRGACAVLLLMVLALITAATSVPSLWHRLAGPALPVVLAGLATEAIALVASLRARPRLAHLAGLGATVLVLWGWFAAQTPRLVGAGLTLHTAAAAHPALVASALSAGAVLAAVIPAFLVLWVMFSRSMLEVIE